MVAYAPAPGADPEPVSSPLVVREAAAEAYGPARMDRRADSAPTRPPVPDPFEDAQALEDLEHEIVTIFANIHAGNHRALILIAEFHRRRGYELGGHRSTAHWLHFRTGLGLGAAREKVRAALALESLPLTSAAMSRGELSFSKVRALTRVATAESEAELLPVAREMTTAELERCVRAWKHLSRDEEAKLEKANHRRRRLSVFPDEQGMYVVRGVVTAEVGALLMRAVEAASDALFCEEAKDETTPEQRRADAMGLLAEQAMAAGFGGESGAGAAASGPAMGSDGAEEDAEDVSAETFLEGGANDRSPGRGGEGGGSGGATGVAGEAQPASPTPLSGTRAERYQVVLHVDPATLSERGEPGRSNFEDGVRVSAETSRRLCCDSSVVRVLRGPDGEVLDVGRRTRTIPPAIRRALEVRDQGCRWPGCSLRFTAAHHVEHWAQGGGTKLSNLMLLCAFHHRKIHEGGWKAMYNEKDDTALFYGPEGGLRYSRRGPGRMGTGKDTMGRSRTEEDRTGTVGDGPTGNGASRKDGAEATEGGAAPPPGSAEQLIRRNRSLGIAPDGWTCTARFHGWGEDAWDLELRALEALDRDDAAPGQEKWAGNGTIGEEGRDQPGR